MKEKLLRELDGIFNWSIAGLKRLNARNGFTDSATNRKILDGYRKMNNPVAIFVEERIDTSQNSALLPKQEIYVAYRTWSDANGYKYLSREAFFKDFWAEMPNHVTESKPTLPSGKRYIALVGVTWKD